MGHLTAGASVEADPGSRPVVLRLLNGTVKATYLVGPRGPECRRDDQAGTIRWYVYDGLGSVVGEVAPDGTA